MLCLGTVSTNLSKLFYAGELHGNGNAFFLDTWVRFAREGKAVALDYSTTNSEAQTPTYVCGGFTVVHPLSVYEHKQTQPGKNTLL